MTNDIAALVAELAALLENSTPGPWLIRTLENFGFNIVHYVDGDKFNIQRVAKAGDEDDAKLIVALRYNAKTLLEALQSLQDERDEARDFYQIEFKRAQRFKKERDEADYHLGQLLGADPGPKYVAALQAAREWWNANDRAALEPAGGER